MHGRGNCGIRNSHGRVEDGVDDFDEDESHHEVGASSGGEGSDTPTEARADASTNAKAKKKTGRPSSNRPVGVIGDSLQAGLSSIERILPAKTRWLLSNLM